MITHLAIVTSPPPVPQQGQAEVGCEYSVPLDNSRRPTYQCYTQAEWDAKQAHEAQVAAQRQAENEQFWSSNGLYIIAIIWLIVAVIIGVAIKKRIEKRRLRREHPHLYSMLYDDPWY